MLKIIIRFSYDEVKVLDFSFHFTFFVRAHNASHPDPRDHLRVDRRYYLERLQPSILKIFEDVSNQWCKNVFAQAMRTLLLQQQQQLHSGASVGSSSTSARLGLGLGAGTGLGFGLGFGTAARSGGLASMLGCGGLRPPAPPPSLGQQLQLHAAVTTSNASNAVEADTDPCEPDAVADAGVAALSTASTLVLDSSTSSSTISSSRSLFGMMSRLGVARSADASVPGASVPGASAPSAPWTQSARGAGAPVGLGRGASVFKIGSFFT